MPISMGLNPNWPKHLMEIERRVYFVQFAWPADHLDGVRVAGLRHGAEECVGTAQPGARAVQAAIAHVHLTRAPRPVTLFFFFLFFFFYPFGEELVKKKSRNP